MKVIVAGVVTRAAALGWPAVELDSQVEESGSPEGAALDWLEAEQGWPVAELGSVAVAARDSEAEGVL